MNHQRTSVKAVFRVMLLGLALLTVSGCGYIFSGEWRDDPKNWSRAFGGDTPRGVVIKNSYYVRMAHFTKEWIYYFKLADSKEARAAIGVNSFLQRTTRTLADLNLDDSRPDWFLRSKLQRVEIYEYPGADSFFAVIDLDSGSIYLHDAQL